MKPRFFAVIILVAMLAATTALTIKSPFLRTPDIKSYEQAWKMADSLKNIGQPQSALKFVDEIFQKASEEKNNPQMIKAHIYRLSLKSSFEEDYQLGAILETKKILTTVEEPIKQLLHSILADLYFSYYQMNRWKILNRSKLNEGVSEDINTWDASVFNDTIAWNYRQSLVNSRLLNSIKVRDYLPVLDTAHNSELYRPALFDFLAYRAIDYFMNDESGISKPLNDFELDDAGYLSLAGEFVKIRMDSVKAKGTKREAIGIYQELAGIHLNDKTPEALIYNELQRLDFVHTNCTLEFSDSLYLKSLFTLLDEYQRNPSSAMVSYTIASFLQNQPDDKSDLKKVEKICKEAIKNFPDSDGAASCRDLLNNLYHPALAVEAQEAVLPEKPMLVKVSYKNVSSLHVRVVKLNYRKWESRRNSNQEELIKAYQQSKAVQTIEKQITNPGDFKNHTTELALEPLATGFYLLMISPEKEFNFYKNPVAYTTFYSTRLSAISKSTKQKSTEFMVLNRETGQTMPNVKITRFVPKYRPDGRDWSVEQAGSCTTGKNGTGKMTNSGSDNYYNTTYLFVAEADSFRIGNIETYFPYKEPARRNTFFFSDRKIYRPGQTIYFKGIVVELNGKKNQIVSDFPSKITLFDANGRELASQNLKTNQYGSFSGSFVLPQSGLNGGYRLQSQNGSHYFQVEDYKRPVFEATFESPVSSYKLGETVTVQGKAKAYAGYAITDAKIKYRVVRSPRYPYPWYWRSMFGGFIEQPEVEIKSGELQSDAQGRFSISFTAVPDRGANFRFNPFFSYSITADVTDLNGETHTAETSVSAGNQALILNLRIAEKLDRNTLPDFSIEATNLAGKSEKTSGNITVYKLIAPNKIITSRPYTYPDKPVIQKELFERQFPQIPYKDEQEFETWKIGETIVHIAFNTANDSLLHLNNLKTWTQGVYKFVINARDRFGSDVESYKFVTLFDAGLGELPYPAAFWTVPLKTVCEPGETASFLIGSAEKNMKVLMEVTGPDSLISSKWLSFSGNQTKVEIPVKEADRGNIHVTFYSVKNNFQYLLSQDIEVPFTNKKLDVTFESFRSELTPGQQETWKIKIKDSNKKNAKAELLACLYDASLDAFAVNSWSFSVFNQSGNFPLWNTSGGFSTTYGTQIYEPPYHEPYSKYQDYDKLNWFGYNLYGGYRHMRGGMVMDKAEMSMAVANEEKGDVFGIAARAPIVGGLLTKKAEEVATPKPITARTDFSETAFFYPQTETDSSGTAVISFKIPESLTKWKLLLLAHDKKLASSVVTKELVTRKDLMVVPNAPRFLRVGDTLVFPVKVVNTSAKSLKVNAVLSFFNPIDNSPVNLLLQPAQASKLLELAPGESKNAEWKIAVNCNPGVVAYRVTASSDAFSDGMEAQLPVLTNQVWLTNSYPMYVNALQNKNFAFDFPKTALGKSGTRLSLEFTSNPAWYAVQALPYLAEPRYECADAIFRVFYANTLAAKIANSNPLIAKTFESWKTAFPDALTSNLQKNQELKSVLLDETPWVTEAQDETRQKNNIALLFNANNIRNSQENALAKLTKLQLMNGGFTWFEGMPDSRYITQQMIIGFGRLLQRNALHLNDFGGLEQMLRKAVTYCDERMLEDYNQYLENLKLHPKAENSYFDPQYLYARSLFIKLFPLETKFTEAHSHSLKLALKNWTGQGIYMQAMLAIAFNRYNETSTAGLIMKSLAEKAIHNDEMGMYWRADHGWFWYQAPIETQAQLIEAFAEVSGDIKAVDEMKTWLLKQKQTQAWENGRATAEAVYALMLQGTDMLADNKPVDLKSGGRLLSPAVNSGTEPGTGYFKKSWTGNEIPAGIDHLNAANPNNHIAWGAVYLQYFEDYDKVKPASSPLSLEKKLFVERLTPSGPVLEAIAKLKTLAPGDKIVVRIVLRTDRAMEFVHMKDLRASGFEPVDVISGYHYRDGLGYYQTTRDAATHFFFSYLPKGTFVFEYSLRISQKGHYNNGFTNIECMYAPEFSARSASDQVVVE